MNKSYAWASKSLLAVFFMGFASGLPSALVGGTLQAWYTTAGISLAGIGALTLVGQPYLWKFLWAPLVDRYSFFFLDRRRSWIFAMQWVLAAGFLWMGFLNPSFHPWFLAFVAVGVAFASATQDVCVDAYRTEILEPEQYGAGASSNTIGFRLAALVSGALALIMADHWGWQWTYFFMAFLFLVEAVVTWFSPATPVIREPQKLEEAIVGPWRELWSRRWILGVLIFILFYKFCDALALSLNTTFLMRGVGFSLTDIGSVAKVAGLAGALLGAVGGGVLFSRLGLYRSLLYFGLIQSVTNLLFMWVALVGKVVFLMGCTMFLDYFTGGMSSVAFVAFLMALCDKRFTATQFALLSAVASTGRIFLGPLAAIMVSHLGWAWFYASTFFMGLPPLLLLIWLNKKIDFTHHPLAQR